MSYAMSQLGTLIHVKLQGIFYHDHSLEGDKDGKAAKTSPNVLCQCLSHLPQYGNSGWLLNSEINFPCFRFFLGLPSKQRHKSVTLITLH